MIYEIESLLEQLVAEGLGDWCDALRDAHHHRLSPKANGHWSEWLSAIGDLPSVNVDSIVGQSVVSFVTQDPSPDLQRQVRHALQLLHPWRKGPFHVAGVDLDAEWRSDQKWRRVQSCISVTGHDVLDVGCGNGYYGWRMLGDGARRVIGIEPYPLYNAQFQLLNHFAHPLPNHVVAATDAVLDSCRAGFDRVFSMGVLYHSKNPIQHLEQLFRSLRSGGKLVLETLVVDGDDQTALVPRDRYAKMRNVWLIPSTLLLERLAMRVGFSSATVVDVTRTTPREQRRTEWMKFESLSDFLDPEDASQTIEGYPSPMRAILIADKK